MRWLIDHFRDIISQGICPRLYDLYPADLGLIQLVYDVHNLTVDIQAATTAARHGNLEVVRWMVKQNNSCLLTSQASRDAILSSAIQSKSVDLVRWCVEEFGAVVAQADIPLSFTQANLDAILNCAIKSTNLDFVRWCVCELGAWLDDGAVAAVTHRSLPVAKYLFEQAQDRLKPPSMGSVEQITRQMLLAASRNGDLVIVKWCVEELDAWDDSAIGWAVRQMHFEVMKYLADKASERGVLETIMQLEQNGVGNYDMLKLFNRAYYEDEHIEWIMEHCPENTDGRIYPNDAMLSWHDEQPWHTFRKMLRYRPAICCQMPRFPLWAIEMGSPVEDLQRLEAIGHPRLFTKKTLNAILRISRDEAVMRWFLTGFRTKSIDWRVVQWAARNGAVRLLEILYGVVMSQNRSRPNHDDEVQLKFLGTVVWETIRHDYVAVLSWVERQECSPAVVQLLWSSKLDMLAVRHGSVGCLSWLRGHNKVTSSN